MAAVRGAIPSSWIFPSQDVKVSAAVAKPEERQNPSILEFAVIAEKNLFHPDRVIPVEKVEKPPEPKPDIILYGTIVTDNMAMAYIEDKRREYSTPGRGKRQKVLKKGDTIDGFVVKKI